MNVSYATRAMIHGILKANAIPADLLDALTDEVCGLMADARARIAALTAEVARKDEALRRLAYWFDTDADYLETLSEAECADNNRMLSIARAALEARND